MNSHVHAELRALWTTRSFRALVVGTLAYPVVVVIGAVLAEADTGITAVQAVRTPADVTIVAALVLGILASAGEHRHGTIVPRLLADPSRGRLLGAKLLSQAAWGALVGAAAGLLALAAGAAYMSSEGQGVRLLSGDVALTLAAVTGLTSLFGVIGAAVGGVVRNQTAAVGGVLVWLLAVEEVLPIVLRDPDLRRWLPRGAASRLLSLTDGGLALQHLWAALVLAGTAAVMALAAWALLTRSDID